MKNVWPTWFYGHRELTGIDDVWKIGIAITPHSAVRLRQRFLWNKFSLDYLYFGRGSHIVELEEIVKKKFYQNSAAFLNNTGSEELFRVKEHELFAFVDWAIADNKFHIERVKLEQPYSATNSSRCPLKVPGETRAHIWCEDLVLKKWGKNPRSSWESLFNYDDA